MGRTFAVICAALSLAFIFCGCAEEAPQTTSSAIAAIETVDLGITTSETDTESDISTDSDSDSDVAMTKSEIGLIALVTMAEAEDESETGKRLVIDTVLNRMDSEDFPDTVFGVVYQPYQFPSMENGRVESCFVDPDICMLVEEELDERLCSDCLYFNAGGYPAWGTPLFHVGSHYFSGGDSE